MNDHEKIRKLLPLVAASAAEVAEEKKVQAHLALCLVCVTELAAWKGLATDLRTLPTPQPSAGLVQRVRSLAATELATEVERRWHKRMPAFLVVFTWAVTCWPVMWWMTGGLKFWLDGYSRVLLIGLVAYTALAGFTATIAVAMLQLRRRALIGGSHEPIPR